MYYYQVITANVVAMEKSEVPYGTTEEAINAAKDSMVGMYIENWPVDIRIYNGPPDDPLAYIQTSESVWRDDIQEHARTKANQGDTTPKYTTYIMQKVRQHLGLESYDTSRDAEINNMSHNAVFRHCLEWEGIIGYDNAIADWIHDIYGVTLV